MSDDAQFWKNLSLEAQSELLTQQSYIRKLKGEIKMLQIRVREANRGARGNIMIAYNALKECDQLRKENRELKQQITTPTNQGKQP